MTRWTLTAAGLIALGLGLLLVAWWPLLLPLGSVLVAIGGVVGLMKQPATSGRLAKAGAFVQLGVGSVMIAATALLLLYVD
jgi:hypothetical protein